METFYSDWLKKNKEENEKAKRRLQNSVLPSSTVPQSSTSATRTSSNSPQPSTSVAEPDTLPQPSTLATRMTQTTSPQPSTSRARLSPTSNSVGSDFSTNLAYENENFELIIERANHLRQKKFNLEDHLFHMKIRLKNSTSAPLLRDILEFLDKGFDYILTNIRRFYNPQDHNVAFLTLYQAPMINGLNTGGFDLQESSNQLIERILTMLEQFLVSNQTLKLDETFKVYLKVLSIEHMSSHKRLHPKRTKAFYKKKKHFGARVNPLKRYNYFWALDVPDSFFKEPIKNIFENECLLTATILAILQHKYFKSERRNRLFLQVQYINSVNSAKQTKAGKILLQELNLLKEATKLPKTGPYDLEATTKILSKFYKCQFFIFDTLHNSNKLTFMYPENYQDDLMPVYLYQPRDANNHLVFIRNINSYFKANVRICFGCQKTFLSHKYQHLCPKIKCCFCCRRFFQSEKTFVHEKLINQFCDKNITAESEIQCTLCNVSCYSKHCYRGHKLLCAGKGTFGYKCLKCKKFSYRYGRFNGLDIKENHKCDDMKRCLFCRKPQEKDHLCELKKEKIESFCPKLAFICMENFTNCSENQSLNDEPIFIIIYVLKDNNLFTKYELSHFECEPKIVITEDVFSYDIKSSKPRDLNEKKYKTTQDFKTNYENLNQKKCFLLSDLLLQLIITWHNTTFICQDEDSFSYVSIIYSHLHI